MKRSLIGLFVAFVVVAGLHVTVLQAQETVDSRLRVIHAVADGPEVDLYIDGSLVATNGNLSINFVRPSDSVKYEVFKPQIVFAIGSFPIFTF